ncbi:Hypothetical protein MAGb_7930 [Mycoplasmopsis agalactiae 14628]|uniref:Uncharacterized protein n=1 Tax=Mycoplasmopsis agalactiae 14628 TaxID=1110504 RepID=I5D529_MYCAA|nr:Eco47II family restriction endonuclease [Mycoplasmopsis agalactiae]EIN14788.1 Hypothetical protein MAGb_7930 [Mycoplasmopsis agalactiae 14628]
MNKSFILNFISEQDFEEHVFNTIKQYRESLKSIDLKKFNKRVIKFRFRLDISFI